MSVQWFQWWPFVCGLLGGLGAVATSLFADRHRRRRRRQAFAAILAARRAIDRDDSMAALYLLHCATELMLNTDPAPIATFAYPPMPDD